MKITRHRAAETENHDGSKKLLFGLAPLLVVDWLTEQKAIQRFMLGANAHSL